MNGCVRQPRQPTGDFGLADAGRPDHQDVLGVISCAQRLGHLRAPPAVAQRNRRPPLGARLADDVLVEFVKRFPGCHGLMQGRRKAHHSIVSIVWLWLV
jgi:hypothetical protein